MQNEKKTSSLTRQVKEYVQEKFQTKHAEVERTKSDDSMKDDSKKGPRFGIRVLPPSVNEKLFGKSPSKMQADNENNTNIERKNEEDKQRNYDSGEFERQNSLNSSTIRRDENGMPTAMPETMMQAALAAKENRKSAHITFSNESNGKKSKGAAPIPLNGDDPDMTTASTDTIIGMDMTDHAKMIVEEAIQSATEHISKQMMNEMDMNADFTDISQVDGEKLKPMSNASTPGSGKKLSSDTESQMAQGKYF